MREVLIDGYNLIRQSDRLSAQERRGGLEMGRETLVRTLAAYRAATGDRVSVVFDGDEGGGFISGASRQQGIEVSFSRPPESADDVIIGRIRRKHGKKAMLVVSSDREIQRAAKRNRIAAMKSEVFETEMLRRISQGKQGSGSEQDAASEDAAYWERLFRTEKGMFEEEDGM